MPLLIGALLAFVVGLFATATRLDGDRGFYPTVTIVIASFYALFAVTGAPADTLVLEIVSGAVFVAAAVIGLSSSLWVVVFALAAHGVFDFIHGRVISNPGVPAWWPAFCLAYDVIAAAYLAALLKIKRVRVTR